MFAVGALEAYFCDAYTDVVAAAIISKSRHSGMVLPDFFYDISFPVRAILEPYAVNLNWKCSELFAAAPRVRPSSQMATFTLSRRGR
jgi:hypothetical protein